MESPSAYRTPESSRSHLERQPRPCCPVCGGTVIPLGGVVQCTRCRYTLCEGCEPDSLRE